MELGPLAFYSLAYFFPEFIYQKVEQRNSVKFFAMKNNSIPSRTITVDSVSYIYNKESGFIGNVHDAIRI